MHCHGAASRCCLSTTQASSFALPPSNASGCLGRSLYWLSHHTEQTHNEQYPYNKKTINITFTLEQSDVLLLVMVTIFPCTATSELLFQHRSRTPKFHHLFWHFSESFHQHSNDQSAETSFTSFSLCLNSFRKLKQSLLFQQAISSY